MTPDPHRAASEQDASDGSCAGSGPSRSEVTLNVNGVRRMLRLDSRVTLLDALRDHLGLTGPRRVATTGSAAHAQSSSMAGASFPA